MGALRVSLVPCYHLRICLHDKKPKENAKKSAFTVVWSNRLLAAAKRISMGPWLSWRKDSKEVFLTRQRAHSENREDSKRRLFGIFLRLLVLRLHQESKCVLVRVLINSLLRSDCLIGKSSAYRRALIPSLRLMESAILSMEKMLAISLLVMVLIS